MITRSNMNQPVRPRIEWIDILKGIGIVFVVFGHLFPNLCLEKHIYSFHMFLFFFLSGYTYKQKEHMLAELKTNALRLLVPFVLWDVLSTLIDIAVGADILQSIKRMILWRATICWNAPIWFLLTLFFVKVLYVCFDYLRLPPLAIYSVLVVMLFLGWLLEDSSYFLKLGTVPIAFFFFGLGACISKEKHLTPASGKRRAVILLFALTVNILFGVILNDRISVIRCFYGQYVYCVIAGISGIVVYVVLSQALAEKRSDLLPWNNIKRLLMHLGKHSMVILCVHYYLFRILASLSNRFWEIDLWHTRGTLKAGVITVFTIVIILQLEKIVVRLLNPKIARCFGFVA